MCCLWQKVVNSTEKQSCLTRSSHDYILIASDCIIHNVLHLTGFTVRMSEINLAGNEVELLETHPVIDGNTTKVSPDASLRTSAQMFERLDSSSNVEIRSPFARSDFETISFLFTSMD